MPARIRLAALALLLVVPCARADDKTPSAPPKGLRVFSAGHSFHFFVPPLLGAMARSAGIEDHTTAGLSAIGGSRVIQHWDVADEKNKLKQALKAGTVDVLTLSPIHLPDPGIENFVKLGLEHNPNIRVFVQENWLPFDIYDQTFKQRPAKVDHNAPTVEDLRKLHEPYFKAIDEHVAELNKKYGKTAVFVAPVGQAVNALRAKIIAGQAPGLKEQGELFADAIGHAKPPLMTLVVYVYYAAIYQRSPVGLPVPAVLAKSDPPEIDKLNRLLQEIAWEAVTSHPLSGVKGSAK